MQPRLLAGLNNRHILMAIIDLRVEQRGGDKGGGAAGNTRIGEFLTLIFIPTALTRRLFTASDVLVYRRLHKA